MMGATMMGSLMHGTTIPALGKVYTWISLPQPPEGGDPWRYMSRGYENGKLLCQSVHSSDASLQEECRVYHQLGFELIPWRYDG